MWERLDEVNKKVRRYKVPETSFAWLALAGFLWGAAFMAHDWRGAILGVACFAFSLRGIRKADRRPSAIKKSLKRVRA